MATIYSLYNHFHIYDACGDYCKKFHWSIYFDLIYDLTSLCLVDYNFHYRYFYGVFHDRSLIQLH